MCELSTGRCIDTAAPDAGVDADEPEGGETDAETDAEPDAGSEPAEDGGTDAGAEASTEGGAEAGTPTGGGDDDDGGCGCRAAGTERVPSVGAWALVLLGLVLAGRRRRAT